MRTSEKFTIQTVDEPLRESLQSLINGSWASPMIAVNGRLWDTRDMPGFAAADEGGRVIGYILYAFHGVECEIMALESLRENAGIGTMLIERVKTLAREHGDQKVVVVTTNDNIRAIRFYQKRGFTLRALRPNILETSRRLKPEIPLIGSDGIPLRDELEFEIGL